MLQKDAVLPGTLDLLRRLMQLNTLKNTYLVGGTALALQLGHRLSIDLDLFSDELPDKDLFLGELDIYTEQISAQAHYYTFLIKNVKVDILKFPYPLITPMVVTDQIRMASLIDIAAMKIISISNRGAKKDFYDLSFLLDQFSIKEMLELYERKTGKEIPFYILRSLVFFEDAEGDADQVMIIRRSWEEVKTIIEQAVTTYYQNGK